MSNSSNETGGIDAFALRLVGVLPQVRPRYQAVADEARAEGLPEGATEFFVFEYTRDLLSGLVADPVAGRAPFTEFAAFLEAELGADPDVDSIIRSYFLTLLPDPLPVDLAADLGPNLVASLNSQRGWRARPADAALVDRLVSAVPALETLRSENVYGDHQDVLVHEFLSDLVRLEIDHLQAGRIDEARTVLDLLEAEFESGTDADEAIATGFVEALPYSDEPGAELVHLLGPRLSAELRRQREH